MAEAIENPFGNDEDDFQICELVSRHIWAIGKNISLYEGPPSPDSEDEDKEDLPSTHIVTLNFDVKKSD